MKTIFVSLVGIVMLIACSDHVDIGSRYVFEGETVGSYLEKHDYYSEYVRLLKKVKISNLSESSLYHLLKARGNFTCFAPTNEAIQAYLDELYDRDSILTAPSWNAFIDSIKQDSIEKVIVYNSIIDGGDDNKNIFETSFFPITNNAEFPISNINDRKLTVTWPDSTSETYRINGEYPLDTRNLDIPVINGVIHQIHKVIAPHDATLSDYFQEVLDNQTEGYLVFARVIQACGLLDTLRAYRDEVYENMYLKGEINNIYDYYTGSEMAPPAHRLLGFTIFAETDDFWRSQGLNPKDDNLLETLSQWILDNHQYSKTDDFTIDKKYESDQNLLYQWITYHILPFKLSAAKLVIHNNEFGYNRTNPTSYTIPVMDYYTTMGQRRLLKIIESRASNGVCLNRFPTTDNGRNGTGQEIYCSPSKEGIWIDRESNQVVTDEVKNGCIYPIYQALSFNDEVRNNLSRERIRFDVASLFPELITNDIRNHGDACPGKTLGIPNNINYEYLKDVRLSENSSMCYWNCYRANFMNLNDDEIKITGRYDITFVLPPVPRESTYEIRYKILSTYLRGIAQIYFGTDPNNMYCPSIPIDLTYGSVRNIIGWEEDTEDDQYNMELDKKLRNNTFMKGGKSITCSEGDERNGYGGGYCHRRILLKEKMEPDKKYYIRFRSVLDGNSKELYLDYMELCPKEVYDNPENPEDIW